MDRSPAASTRQRLATDGPPRVARRLLPSLSGRPSLPHLPSQLSASGYDKSSLLSKSSASDDAIGRSSSNRVLATHSLIAHDSTRNSAGRAATGGPRPILELRHITRAIEVRDAFPQINLRIGDGAVVDRRADLLEDELEQQPRRKLSDLLVELLDEVAADRLERFLGRVVGQCDGHAVCIVRRCGQRSFTIASVMPSYPL